MIENVVNKTLKITILMDFELMFLLAISFIKHKKKIETTNGRKKSFEDFMTTFVISYHH